MSTILSYARDVQGYPSQGLAFSKMSYSALLSQNSVQTFSVPFEQKQYLMRVVTQSDKSVWVALNETASYPTSSAISSTSSELVCASQYFEKIVYSQDVVSFVTSDSSAQISVTLYAMPY